MCVCVVKPRACVARRWPTEYDHPRRIGGLGDGEACSAEEGDSRFRYSLA